MATTEKATTEKATTEKATTEKATKSKQEREDIYIPKGYANDDPNLFVSVNGKNYLLPKGKTSSVPVHVAAEIKRSLKAQEIQDENSEKLLEKAKQPIEM